MAYKNNGMYKGKKGKGMYGPAYFSTSSKTMKLPKCEGLTDQGDYPDTQMSIYRAQDESVKMVKREMPKNYRRHS